MNEGREGLDVSEMSEEEKIKLGEKMMTPEEAAMSKFREKGYQNVSDKPENKDYDQRVSGQKREVGKISFQEIESDNFEDYWLPQIEDRLESLISGSATGGSSIKLGYPPLRPPGMPDPERLFSSITRRLGLKNSNFDQGILGEKDGWRITFNRDFSEEDFFKMWIAASLYERENAEWKKNAVPLVFNFEKL